MIGSIRNTTKYRVFVVGFNLLGLDQEELTAFLESRPEVQDWLSTLPGQLLVIGSSTAGELASLLRDRFAAEFFFVATIKPRHCNGCLPREAWDFIVKSGSTVGQVRREVSEGVYPEIDCDCAKPWNDRTMAGELVGTSR